MPRVPVPENLVGVAPISATKLQAPDLRGTGLDAVARGLQQIGAAGSDMADTLHTVGVETARMAANDADTAFSAYGTALQNDPQNGILSREGKDAVDAYQPTIDALRKKRDEIAGGLLSPLAKQAFQRMSAERLTAFQAGIDRHVAVQDREQQDKTSLTTIEANSSDALANYQNEDATSVAVSRIVDQYAALAHRHGFDDTVAAQMAREKVASVRLGIVSRMSETDPAAARDYATRYANQMTGEAQASADKVVRIATDRQEAELRRKAAEQRAQETHDRGLVREQLNTAKVQLGTGAGTSADWEKLAVGYTGIGDTSSAAEAHSRAVEMKASDKYRGAALPQLDQRITALEGKRSLGVDEASELKGLRTLRDTTAQRLDQPGGALEQFQFATGQQLDPLNPNDPNTYTRRAQRAADAATAYGRPVVEPLVKAEVQPLKDLVAGNPGQRLQALTTIAKFGDPRAIDGAARQIADRGDGSFRVAATLMTLPGDAGYQAARDILRGPDAAKTNPTVYLPAAAKLSFGTYAGPALRGLSPDYSADVMSAARDLYVARMSAAGHTQWDEAAWRNAIDTATGGYQANGIRYGGVTNYRGTSVSIPPGWTGDGVFRRLARATGQDWSAASVKGPPVWPDGTAVYTGQLRELVPVRLGGTQYGFLTRNNRFLTAKRGGPYVVDVAKVPWR